MGFLQTPPHDGRPRPQLTVPIATPVVYFHHHAVSHAERTNKKAPAIASAFLGAGSGIRTHAPLRANGFQDRLVMTTSISLHIQFCRRALPDRLIIPHTDSDCQVYVKKRAGLPLFFLKKVLHLCLFYGNITVLSVILSAYMQVTALYGGDRKRASIRRSFHRRRVARGMPCGYADGSVDADGQRPCFIL